MPSRNERRFKKKLEAKRAAAPPALPERTQTATHGKVAGSNAEVELLKRNIDGTRNDAETVQCHFCKLDYKDADPALGPFYIELCCPTCSSTLEIERAKIAIEALLSIEAGYEPENARLIAREALERMKVKVPS